MNVYLCTSAHFFFPSYANNLYSINWSGLANVGGSLYGEWVRSNCRHSVDDISERNWLLLITFQIWLIGKLFSRFSADLLLHWITVDFRVWLISWQWNEFLYSRECTIEIEYSVRGHAYYVSKSSWTHAHTNTNTKFRWTYEINYFPVNLNSIRNILCQPPIWAILPEVYFVGVAAESSAAHSPIKCRCNHDPNDKIYVMLCANPLLNLRPSKSNGHIFRENMPNEKRNHKS